MGSHFHGTPLYHSWPGSYPGLNFHRDPREHQAPEIGQKPTARRLSDQGWALSRITAVALPPA